MPGSIDPKAIQTSSRFGGVVYHQLESQRAAESLCEIFRFHRKAPAEFVLSSERAITKLPPPILSKGHLMIAMRQIAGLANLSIAILIVALFILLTEGAS
jgi:hypothetical protein